MIQKSGKAKLVPAARQDFSLQTMHGDEAEMGRLRNEGRFQRLEMMPYVEKDVEHLGSLQWSFQVVFGLPAPSAYQRKAQTRSAKFPQELP